jgi:hypothetical protein
MRVSGTLAFTLIAKVQNLTVVTLYSAAGFLNRYIMVFFWSRLRHKNTSQSHMIGDFSVSRVDLNFKRLLF